jgi:hypothetical protein
MPRFYFHLAAPGLIDEDEVGIDTLDLDSAYLEACEAIPGVIAEMLDAGHDPSQVEFRIADAFGVVLMEVPLFERVKRRRAGPPEAGPAGRKADALIERAASLTRQIRQRAALLRETMAKAEREAERLRRIRAELAALVSGMGEKAMRESDRARERATRRPL